MNNRKKLIFDTNNLQIDSKIKLFNFININITSNYMENTNGMFFSLNDISNSDIEVLLNYIDDLKKQEQMDNDSSESMFEIQEGKGERINQEDKEENITEKETTLTPKKASFEYDRNVVKELENSINKVNKKSIHVKYSIAKKKYNKQHIQLDPKKIDNTDLKELEEEAYML